MTNEELLKEFQRISLLPNILEKQVALKAFRKQYRKSEYFRATRMSLKKIFALYELNRVPDFLNKAYLYTDTGFLADKINEVLEQVDLSLTVNKLLSLINYDKLQEMVSGLSENDSVQLNEMLKELKTAQANLEQMR